MSVLGPILGRKFGCFEKYPEVLGANLGFLEDRKFSMKDLDKFIRSRKRFGLIGVGARKWSAINLC
jgi:hypothetical protein